MNEKWDDKKLGEIASIQYGYTAKSNNSEIGPKFLRITDIKNNSVKWPNVPFCEIKDNEIQKYLLQKGDIVFARTGATTGKSYLIEDPPSAIFASYLIRVKIIDLKKITPSFLYLFFQSGKFWSTINQGISGSAQGGFNATKLSKMEIPIPPLPEQRRIVAVLDQAFEAIDQAIENTEKNLQNAQELFESYLDIIFSKSNNNWEEKRFGDLCNFVRGPFGSSLKKSFFVNTGYAVYEQSHAINDQFEDVRYFIDDKKFEEMKRFEVNPGDLIMSCSGTMGKIAIVPNNMQKGIINQALLKITPSKWIGNRFLKYWMESSNFQNKLIEFSKGAAIKNIASVRVLKNIYLPVPSLSEQEQILSQLDALGVEAKKLEDNYRQKLADLKELRQSFLHKAFEGELRE